MFAKRIAKKLRKFRYCGRNTFQILTLWLYDCGLNVVRATARAFRMHAGLPDPWKPGRPNWQVKPNRKTRPENNRKVPKTENEGGKQADYCSVKL